MDVILIKRNKITHCGVHCKDNFSRQILEISICNCRWDVEDKVSTGDIKEVTCKRCLKKIAKADENGYITLGR